MRKVTEQNPNTPDFEQVVKLLALFSDATNRLSEMESEANQQFLEIIDDKLPEYAQLQEACKQAETALETICRMHLEWFTKVKSIKTPYGKVLFHSSTELDIANDEATVRLLRAEHKANPKFAADDYIRSVEAPNVEALESLSDAELERFMIKRVRKENFSATPAKVGFGKAVKEAAEPKQAAA